MKNIAPALVSIVVLLVVFFTFNTDIIENAILTDGGEKAKMCPEMWIIYEGEEYFVIDDKLWQAEGFDTEWTEENCDVSPPKESTKPVR